MSSHELIEEILQKAVWAPSGDNSQPWKFDIHGDNQLDVINIPGKDNEILNYNQSGSLVAHGALIQNVRLLAQEKGFDAEVEYFPETTSSNITARIKFNPTANVLTGKEDELISAIPNRRTNRKPYEDLQMSADLIKSLQDISFVSKDVQLVFSSENADLDNVSKQLAQMEKIALRVPELHELFFKDILWSNHKNLIGEPGLYIKSMELPFPAPYAMRLLRYWPITNFLNKTIGLAEQVSAQMATVYAASPVLGAFIIDDYRPESFVAVGEALQRVWLKCTSQGIALQPVTGILFLEQRVQAGDLGKIPNIFETDINLAYKTISNLFDYDQDGKKLAFLFRIGYAKPPSAQTNRLPPVIV